VSTPAEAIGAAAAAAGVAAGAERDLAQISHETLVEILRALRRRWYSSRCAFDASALMMRVQLDTTAH
jgi:hypothetical protein